MRKRILALLLALGLLMIPGFGWNAQAAEVDAPSSTVEEAAKELCQQMVQRQKTCTVTYQGENAPSADSLYETALTALNNGKDGDYLIWQVSSHKGSSTTAGEAVTYTYQMSYLTTAEQEKAVDKRVEEILSSLNISGKSDYEKVKAIYRWIYSNVEVEVNSFNSYKDTQLRTAYGALTNGISVCLGHAELLCRMLGEEGISSRMIAGYSGASQSNGSYSMNHVWNIVKLGSYYYNCDVVWDATLYQNQNMMMDYCLLRGENSEFNNNGRFVHVRCGKNGTGSAYNGVDYTSSDFYQAYPMSDKDYQAGADVESYPNVEPYPEMNPKPEVKPEPEAKPETKPEVKPEPEAKPDTKPEAKPETEVKPDTKPEAKPEPEVKPDTKPETKPETEVKPDTKPEVKPEPEVRPEPDTKPDSDSNSSSSNSFWSWIWGWIWGWPRSAANGSSSNGFWSWSGLKLF